jgi:hypothetical protein
MAANPNDVAAQLQEQITILQGQLNTLTTAAIATVTAHTNVATVGASAPPSRRTAKVSPPDSFDGTAAKTTTFIRSLEIYLHVKANEFSSDEERVLWALSFMKTGIAGPWADIYADKIMTPRSTSPEPDSASQNTGAAEPATIQVPFEEGSSSSGSSATSPEKLSIWNQFIKDLKFTFGDQDPGATARYKMEQLRQGSRTAEEYSILFRELAVHTGYNDIGLRTAYEKGLNGALADNVYRLYPVPDTFQGWMTASMRLDRQYRQREANKRLYAPRPQPQRVAAATTPTPTTSRRPGRLSEEERERRMKMGLCFRCGTKGHLASACNGGPPQTIRASTDGNPATPTPASHPDGFMITPEIQAALEAAGWRKEDF